MEHPVEPPGDVGDGEHAVDDLVELIATRVVERLAPLIVGDPDLEREPGRSDRLWTADTVADHLGVGVSFVYEHADELGCIRLGAGPNARLRFDPTIVRRGLGPLADGPRTTGRQRRRTRRRARAVKDPSVDLLDFDRDP